MIGFPEAAFAPSLLPDFTHPLKIKPRKVVSLPVVEGQQLRPDLGQIDEANLRQVPVMIPRELLGKDCLPGPTDRR